MPLKQDNKIPKNVKVLGIVSLLTDASSEMIYPLIPLFIVVLGSGAVTLGIIEGMAETTAAILKLVGGIISDKVRKRKMLVLMGYTISSFTRPFTGIVSNAWQIVIIRMCDRVCKGIRTAPRDALIASSVHKGIFGKAFGFHRAMDHSGAVIGPFLASDRIGRKIVINIGWSVYVIVYIGFAILDNLSGIVQLGITLLLFTLYAIFYAFSEGAEIAFRLNDQKIRR